MAGGTDEDFEQGLDNDLGWRRAELDSLRAQLERAASESRDSPATRALTRSLAVLLYAHWEGYTRQAFERYLQLVLRRKPPVCEASDGFAISHVAHLAGRLARGDDGARSAAIELIRGSGRPRLSLQKNLVDTKSNLKFDVLEALLRTFDVPVEEFATKRNLINVKLCNQRNEIAHGRGNFPAVEDIMELHDKVIELLGSVRALLIGGVRTQAYRVPLPESDRAPG